MMPYACLMVCAFETYCPVHAPRSLFNKCTIALLVAEAVLRIRALCEESTVEYENHTVRDMRGHHPRGNAIMPAETVARVQPANGQQPPVASTPARWDEPPP